MNSKRLSRRTLFIGLGSLFILLLTGLYTWQSIAFWQGYESKVRTEEVTLKRLRDEAIGADTAKKRLVAIRALDDKLGQRSELCAVNGLYAWQALIIPTIRNGVKECEDKVKKLDKVAPPLRALRQYLDTGEKLQSAISLLAPNGGFTETNWAEKGLERAKQVQSVVKKLPAGGEGVKLKEQAVALSNNLVTSWEGVIKANDAKDKTGFIAAAAAVAKAYADFTALADSSDAVIKDKASRLIESAKDL